MNRRTFIELIRRQIYGEQPSDDATITVGLVNKWLDQGVAVAAKANYKDSLSIDGINYVNNSFYTTFKNISIASDGNFTWKVSLPQIPVGIGRNEGISVLELTDNNGNITRPFVPISENQRTYYQGMPPIPNKVIYYQQGEFIYIKSALTLSDYTANVTMISGGDGTDLGSTINVPDDYVPIIVEFLKQQLLFQRNIPVDVTNDGLDAIKTT